MRHSHTVFGPLQHGRTPVPYCHPLPTTDLAGDTPPRATADTLAIAKSALTVPTPRQCRVRHRTMRPIRMPIESHNRPRRTPRGSVSPFAVPTSCQSRGSLSRLPQRKECPAHWLGTWMEACPPCKGRMDTSAARAPDRMSRGCPDVTSTAETALLVSNTAEDLSEKTPAHLVGHESAVESDNVASLEGTHVGRRGRQRARVATQKATERVRDEATESC